ncbi:restriction endonuclease subunit S [Streptomyces iakyrus]|uniref:restriction endonuclease subunit S n=1 Tax=Streptomyces iakyrus TaxID=68219 RepID=UPI0036FDBE2F
MTGGDGGEQGIPWKRVALDRVAARGSGHTPNKKRATYWNGDIPWVSLKDASRLDRGLISATAESITHAGLANSSAVVHPAGSVVLLRDAGIGKVAVLGADMAVSQHFMAWHCGPRLNNWFLYYYLESMKAEFERISNGSTIKTIGVEYFRQLKVPLPAIEEQQLIARMLRDADGLIAALERMIAKKQAVKQGLMQQLLTGRMRLPGFTQAWSRRNLSELLRPRSEFNSLSENLTVLTCTKSMGFMRSMDYFKNQVFSRDLRGYRVIYRGDIGYPANHVEEGSIGVQELEDRALVSPIYVVMEPGSGVDSYFLQRMLKLDTYRQKFSRATNASVDRRGSLRWPEFSRIEVSVPHIEEQRRISCVLRDSELEIAKLERRLRVAQDVKRGMMQELLTGRKRLLVQGEDGE